jgi:hypothetical protein
VVERRVTLEVTAAGWVWRILEREDGVERLVSSWSATLKGAYAAMTQEPSTPGKYTDLVEDGIKVGDVHYIAHQLYKMAHGQEEEAA